MTDTRVGSREIKKIIKKLSDRDLAIIKSVAKFKLQSAPQIEALHFDSHGSKLATVRASRRTLERLFNNKLLIRLKRRVGGVRAGSSSFIYGLGPIGYRIMFPGSKKRSREPSYSFIDHTLAVSQVFTDLRVHIRPLNIKLEHYECEPDCWRQFSSAFELNQILKPDLFLSVSNELEELLWFIEVDLSSESSKTIARKCQIYNSYFNTGTEQDTLGAFPKVLWITNSNSRALSIRQTIKNISNVNQELFDVTVIDHAADTLAGGLSHGS